MGDSNESDAAERDIELTEDVPDGKVDGNIIVRLEDVNLPTDPAARTELQTTLEILVRNMLHDEYGGAEWVTSDNPIERRRAILRSDTRILARLYNVDEK